MNIDIEKLSLKELKDLRNQVEKAINSFEERRKAAALVELEEAAKKLGFSLSELTGASAKKRKAVAPKYANPADPSQTWTGRGRRPRWVVEAEAAGKKVEDFLI
ncbi:MAG: H-NS histone family protein [Rhodobacteraceae bacterium]|nr:H-NS histone family protein [Paracoccaceae bacterium]